MNDYKKTSLFISKSLEELEHLPEFCRQNNIELFTHSFINFEATNFSLEQAKPFDVVFFSSPRAVHFFLTDIHIKNKQIAVAGESTKKAIVNLGYKVDFVPTRSGNISQSAQEFANWVGQKKVLFPCSNISNLSYSQYLSKEQFQSLEVYKTQISTKKIDKFDNYVFTSPSNVNGFFQSNTIYPNSKIITWGESTDNELKKHTEHKAVIRLSDSSEEGLINHLMYCLLFF